jgi:hypothetical protein
MLRMFLDKKSSKYFLRKTSSNLTRHLQGADPRGGGSGGEGVGGGVAIFLSTVVTFVKVLKQAPVATSYMLTRLETFQPQGGESFYSTAVTFVKVFEAVGIRVNIAIFSKLLKILSKKYIIITVQKGVT